MALGDVDTWTVHVTDSSLYNEATYRVRARFKHEAEHKAAMLFWSEYEIPEDEQKITVKGKDGDK